MIALLSISCELQHRRYRSGFFISGINKGGSELAFRSESSQKKHNQVDTCDVVEFSDGTKIKIRIIESSDRELKYKFCDGDDVIRRVSRRQVMSVWYADGRKEGMAANVQAQPQPTLVSQPSPVTQPTLVTSTDSLSKTASLDSVAAPSTSLPVSPSACDRITLRNGTEVNAKVMEVGTKDIRYRLCDMMDGPVFVQPKREVFMITYTSGQKDVFPEEPLSQDESQGTVEEYVRPRSAGAIWGLVCSLAGIYPAIFFGSIAGIIFGTIYFNKSKIDPIKYPKGKMARSAIIIGAITLMVYTMVLILGNI